MPVFDVILVLPYPFSDHPAFPEGILKKALELEGFRVGVLETPLWQKAGSFAVLGRPRLFFAVVSGPVDSIVLNYTSTRKRRKEDRYQHGGASFFPDSSTDAGYRIRPDRTTVVFSNGIRAAFRDTPIVIGGVEASLRRFAHYDFQQDKIRRSILFDSRADVLVTGMGEKQLVRLARFLRDGGGIGDFRSAGIARIGPGPAPEEDFLELPAWEELLEDPRRLVVAHRIAEQAVQEAKGLVQRHGDRFVIDSPMEPYDACDLEHIYRPVYGRRHLQGEGYSPALRMNLFSVASHRGCGGGCSFCAICLHEGRKIISRPVDSILEEIAGLTRHPEWKGYISDIGGASAEMYGCDCPARGCRKISCVHPRVCGKFPAVGRYMELLRECRKVKGVRKVFLGSGIRFDAWTEHPELLEEILVHHAGSFLRIAPEHTEGHVLSLMRKPSVDVLESFVGVFRRVNRGLKRKVALSPYLIVGHPGETSKDVLEMKKKIKSLGLKATEVQIFTPSPGTLSTAMYFAGCSASLEPIPVERRIGELMKRKRILVESD